MSSPGEPSFLNADTEEVETPREPFGRLFLRFLRFGFLAWGGPVAQIAMLKRELVEQERWISIPRFNRTLALYQVLPGPEAHELAVYFGMRSRGRVGGALAGLGFMLPGFLLMLALSWVYVRFGTDAAWVKAVFIAVQAAVAALILRAVQKIAEHAMTRRWLWLVAAGVFAAQLAQVPFLVSLAVGGLVSALAFRGSVRVAAAFGLLAIAATGGWILWRGDPPNEAIMGAGSQALMTASLASLLLLGLKAGLLTFGGAYTAIPVVREQAVVQGHWLSDAQFLDGLALSGVLPAPFIIFTTFVGYVGGGVLGACATTVGTFLPAFAFTLLAHERLETLVAKPGVNHFLDGVTAGVVGLIAATALPLVGGVLSHPFTIAVAVLAFITLWKWKHRLATPAVIGAAGLAGLGFFPFAK